MSAVLLRLASLSFSPEFSFQLRLSLARSSHVDVFISSAFRCHLQTSLKRRSGRPVVLLPEASSQ